MTTTGRIYITNNDEIGGTAIDKLMAIQEEYKGDHVFLVLGSKEQAACVFAVLGRDKAKEELDKLHSQGCVVVGAVVIDSTGYRVMPFYTEEQREKLRSIEKEVKPLLELVAQEIGTKLALAGRISPPGPMN